MMTKRGNKVLKVDPRNADTIYSISYTADGRIKSEDSVIDEDLNKRLNLNCATVSLPENRKAVLDALIEDIRKNGPKGDIKNYCKRRLDMIRSMDDKKIPFIGIIIWWLEKHANR